MSKQIAQTVGGKRIAWLLAFLAFVAVLFTLATQATAEAPPSSITFTKVGEGTGSEVMYFTLRADNTAAVIEDDEDSETSEDNGSGPLLIQDFLPDGAYWYLLSAEVHDGDGNNSDLDCVVEDTVIACNVRNILGQHLNKKQSAFVHGYVEIVIYGVAKKCGTFDNVALLMGAGSPRTARASASFPCPATPTAIPTSTPTSAPTLVPPTATPQIIVVTATPTSTPTVRLAPLPPNTGDSEPPASQGGDMAQWAYLALIAGALTFGIGGYAVSRRSR